MIAKHVKYTLLNDKYCTKRPYSITLKFNWIEKREENLTLYTLKYKAYFSTHIHRL